MFCRTYNVPTAGQSVAELIQNDLPTFMQDQVGIQGFRCDIIIQAPATNGNDVLFGDNTEQAVAIIAGGSSGLFKAELNNLYVSGTGGDNVVIFLAY